jgi:hypothetical protein
VEMNSKNSVRSVVGLLHNGCRKDVLTPKMKPFFRLNFVVDIMVLGSIFKLLFEFL